MSVRQLAVELSLPPLTPMEHQVLRAFAHCDTYQEMARLFGITPFTIRVHARSVFRKLQVKSRNVAVAKAFRLGLLTLQDMASAPKEAEIYSK